MKLICKDVSKQFGSNPALRGVNLSVDGGEIRALLGGNGSGKSTLSKILGGALHITSGSMELNGEPYAPSSPVDAKRRGVVFTSQELSLFENLAVEENIALCSHSVERLWKNETAKTAEKVRALLRKYGIEGLADKAVRSLPANEQYLVEFMKAVYQKADVLIIDEITSALYQEDTEIVRRVMQEYKAQGKIILFISHRMPEIMKLCDTVTVLRNGAVISTHSTRDVTESLLVSQMTGLDVDCGSAPHRPEKRTAAKTLLAVRQMPLPQFGTAIDLEVKEGEIIGIAGLQGHGQSDLVRQLFGLNPAVTPVVELQGRTVSLSAPMKAIQNRIAFISGDRTLEGVFEERSIEENAEVVSRMILGRKVDAAAVLDAFHVKYQNKGDRITSLSGGNQQKVVLARWLSNAPLVVLADDPTKGIDVQARRDVHKTVVKIAEMGSAVLMVSSDHEELVNLTSMSENSRILVLYEGQIVKTLTGGDISAENIARASVNLG